MRKPFVSRMYHLDGAPLVVGFQQPEIAEGGEYRCAWSIDWPNGTEADDVPGEDGVQAILLAMRLVHTKLADTDEYQHGRLTLWDGSDLGLPPRFIPEGDEPPTS